MKEYRGHRTQDGVVVTVNDRPLNPRFDLHNHSPTGFEWGYGGSGPAQLALAIMADHIGNDDQALSLYQSFKSDVIAGLPKDGWTLTSQELDAALRQIREQSLGGPN